MPFDSQQFLQELQAIMQQQRPPRPDSYSAADSAVQIHPYMEGKEPRHAFPSFLDDHQVILFGGGIRIFDTQKGKFVQTISRLRNAEIALSPTKSKIFLVNATAKDVVVCVLYERIDGVFTEKHRTSIKGVNTDGGTPCFSSDEKYAYFCTEFHRVWRYSVEDGTCACIYEREYADQFLNLDVYADQLLIMVGASRAINHRGIDVLDKDGHCLKSLRYPDGQEARRTVEYAKWLNADEILMIFTRSYTEPYDDYQVLSWRTAASMEGTAADDWKVERTGSNFSEIFLSPKRNYVAYVWFYMGNDKPRYTVSVYRMKSRQKLCEFNVKHLCYMDFAFSDDDRHCFLCAGTCYLVDLPAPDVGELPEST